MRVAPLRMATIPQLELSSAFLLSKLIPSVHESLQPQMPPMGMCHNTDSKVSLYWIRRKENEWKPFVHPEFWYNCPGYSNPTKLPSRELSMIDFAVNQLRQKGPEWLQFNNTVLPEAETLPMLEPCVNRLSQPAAILSV